jgi:helix-turn-helix protein
MLHIQDRGRHDRAATSFSHIEMWRGDVEMNEHGHPNREIDSKYRPPKGRSLPTPSSVENDPTAKAEFLEPDGLPPVSTTRGIASLLELPPEMIWLTYEQAAEYTGWSVRYLRNLVSADQIPVYGGLRSRRFRLDMLVLFLMNRDAAMRKFLLEGNEHHGD